MKERRMSVQNGIKAISDASEDLRREILHRIEEMPHEKLEKISAFLETL